LAEEIGKKRRTARFVRIPVTPGQVPAGDPYFVAAGTRFAFEAFNGRRL
jgi:hypothetical protein